MRRGDIRRDGKKRGRLTSRHGYQVAWFAGRALGAREQAAIGKVPRDRLGSRIDRKGQGREGRSDRSDHQAGLAMMRGRPR
jgi:hypothetical protein